MVELASRHQPHHLLLPIPRRPGTRRAGRDLVLRCWRGPRVARRAPAGCGRQRRPTGEPVSGAADRGLDPAGRARRLSPPRDGRRVSRFGVPPRRRPGSRQPHSKPVGASRRLHVVEVRRPVTGSSYDAVAVTTALRGAPLDTVPFTTFCRPPKSPPAHPAPPLRVRRHYPTLPTD